MQIQILKTKIITTSSCIKKIHIPVVEYLLLHVANLEAKDKNENTSSCWIENQDIKQSKTSEYFKGANNQAINKDEKNSIRFSQIP